MYEYKVVPAPIRATRAKGLKTTADRFSHALAERINAEAAGGWQFQRIETLACEDRGRLWRSKSSAQTVMIFARALGFLPPDAGTALAAVRDADTTISDGHAREFPSAPAPVYPEVQDPMQQRAPQGRQEPLFRSNPLMRPEIGARAEPVLRPPAPPRDESADD